MSIKVEEYSNDNQLAIISYHVRARYLITRLNRHAIDQNWIKIEIASGELTGG